MLFYTVHVILFLDNHIAQLQVNRIPIWIYRFRGQTNGRRNSSTEQKYVFINNAYEYIWCRCRADGRTSNELKMNINVICVCMCERKREKEWCVVCVCVEGIIVTIRMSMAYANTEISKMLNNFVITSKANVQTEVSRRRDRETHRWINVRSDDDDNDKWMMNVDPPEPTMLFSSNGIQIVYNFFFDTWLLHIFRTFEWFVLFVFSINTTKIDAHTSLTSIAQDFRRLWSTLPTIELGINDAY